VEWCRPPRCSAVVGFSGDDDRLRAGGLVRVQGLLGRSSARPVLSAVAVLPNGSPSPTWHEAVPRADPGQPWPGQCPTSPTVLLDDPVELFDADDNPSGPGRGLFSADPARLTAPRSNLRSRTAG